MSNGTVVNIHVSFFAIISICGGPMWKADIMIAGDLL